MVEQDSETEQAPTGMKRSFGSITELFKFVFDNIKSIYSVCLLIFSIIIVHASIFSEQTVGVKENGIPAVAAFFIIWFLIVWLAVMEGGQGVLVSLQHVEKEKYAETHPYTLKNTKLAHEGDNMERFIVGRQFLTFLVIFLANMMGSAVEGAEVLNMPSIINDIFLGNGIAMVLFVITLGQLTSQVNAANCMLDFINNRFMYYAVTRVALAIESSGLLHAVYLVQILFFKITGQSGNSKAPPRTTLQNAFFWGRIMVSLAILGISFAVVLEALFNEQTAMWDGVPTFVSVILFFVLMCIVGLMEGMQIAMFAVMKMPEEELEKHPIAKKNCELTFADGHLESFLIGRQVLCTLCMFVVARISSIAIGEGESNIFGVSDGMQKFFDAGILGAIITTLVASLAWRIIASSFPLPFLSNPLIYVIIRVALFVDATGICSASKVAASIQYKLFRYQPDEEYMDVSYEPPEPVDIVDPENRRASLRKRKSVYDAMADMNEDHGQSMYKRMSFYDVNFTL